MITPRPARRVAVARLRRLARYLEGLPREEYNQENEDRCVIGHGRRVFRLTGRVYLVDYLGIPEGAEGPIVGALARVRTPRGKARQLRALAARLAR